MGLPPCCNFRPNLYFPISKDKALTSAGLKLSFKDKVVGPLGGPAASIDSPTCRHAWAQK